MSKRVGLPLRSARIDTSAIRHNLRTIDAAVAGRGVLADVSADAHGHGAAAVATAALAGGARGLVVATIGEAAALRGAGIGRDSDAPIIAWQHPPAGNGLTVAFRRAAESGITPAVASAGELAAATRAGIPAVHLAAAIGTAVTGCRRDDWQGLVERAALAQRDAGPRVSGIMGLSERRTPDSRTELAELNRDRDEFRDRVTVARRAGLTPTIAHHGGSAAVFCAALGDTELPRVGRALYGLSPFRSESADDLGLAAAMVVSARIIATKTVAAGEGISYGYTYRTAVRSNLALVAIGYVHGIDRSASNRATALLNGASYPIAGRIAMDVFVLDLGADTARVGEEVVLFGDPRSGHPSAAQWAATIGSGADEVVTGITAQVPREYR